MKVLIAAAGTAGHINPAISIANEIKKNEPDSKIVFIGTERGLEKDLVPRAGYELKTINAYGLDRKITVENLKKLYKTLKGIKEAKIIVKDFQPDILIGTGGYICGACVIAAKSNNIPVVLHESNCYPGKAVRMLEKKVDSIFISFEDTRKYLKRCKNIVYTGTPIKIKKKIYTINEKLEIIKSLNLNETKPIVLIFGGSQGAQKINEALINIIEKNMIKKYQIIWATGQKQFEIINKILLEKNIKIEQNKSVKVVPYIYNMEEVENVSDLIVARSGAMTITEIANLAKPSILIPLPNVSNNHQMYNAKILEKANAAKIIENEALNGDLLNSYIEEIVLNKNKKNEMGQNAFTISNLNAEEKIYKEIKKLIK